MTTTLEDPITAAPPTNRPPLVHLRQLGGQVALCGTKIKGEPSNVAAQKCVVCVELAYQTRDWSGR